MKAAIAAAAALLLAAGCGSHGRHFTTTDADARQDATAARRQWLNKVRADARRNPGRRFQNLSHTAFETRLRARAGRYGMSVQSVAWRRGIQAVPDVVVTSGDYDATARNLPRLLDAIDPPPRSNSRAFEAIFLEADDSHGVPYIAIYDALRAHVMGGQWARDESLYPYAHG